MPTSRFAGTGVGPAFAMISRSSAGAILQPQPPPWLNCGETKRRAIGSVHGEKVEVRGGVAHCTLRRLWVRAQGGGRHDRDGIA